MINCYHLSSFRLKVHTQVVYKTGESEGEGGRERLKLTKNGLCPQQTLFRRYRMLELGSVEYPGRWGGSQVF